VSDRQWFEFLYAWYPMSEEQGRSRTIATRVREELVLMSSGVAGVLPYGALVDGPRVSSDRYVTVDPTWLSPESVSPVFGAGSLQR